MSALLEVEDLEVRYGAIAALQGVTVAVHAGEIVALIGPNGAGKTSLLNAVVGVVRPTRGRIRLEGEDLAGLTPERIVGRGVALVPENREIFTKLTVWENLLIGASKRRDSRAIQRDLAYVCELFPILASRRSAPAGVFSGGEQQMLAIARALMSAPRLLLLDEPSLGLAPVVTDTVYDAISALRRDGMTILLVEQDAERAMSVCERAHLLAAGLMQFSGSPAEIQAHGDMDAAYFGLAGAESGDTERPS